MKMEFSIHGRLKVEDCKNHQDMIIKLSTLLRENGYFFIGETKQLDKDK
jgi:hypothetical protein